MSLNAYSILFSQEQINEEALDSFYKYRSEITEYFTYYYDEEYSGEMLYYNSRLMSIFSSIIDRKIISDSIIDLIIEMYKETLLLKVPNEDKEMYIETGLGENGHELYTKIFSIMYFSYLETNINSFSKDDQIVVKKGIEKLKQLFSTQDWEITVNYFNNKYNK
jgi:hypothetical protein